MTEAPKPHAVGDRLRVIVDEPYDTELMTGDLVTVQKLTEDETGKIIYIVATSYGLRYLHDDVVAPFEAKYAPSEPDEIVDAQLSAMIDADPELAAFLKNAETSLGAEEPEVGSTLAAPANPDLVGGMWTRPGPDDIFHVTDPDDDDLDVYYSERVCPEHGREGVFFLQINDGESVALPASFAPALVIWLHRKIMYSRRPDTA